jgi:hypothetical protein
MAENHEGIPFATDDECEQRRQELIANGVISPADRSELVSRKGGAKAITTRKNSKEWREHLIETGVINPNPEYSSPPYDISRSVEEGEYSSQPIGTDEEYEHRKNLYLWVVSDILKTRKRLSLDLRPKAEDAPDWHF